MATNPGFNLFEVLDLDPDAAWNPADFDRRLKEKRGEWSKLVNSPTKKGLAAKRNIELIAKLVEVAGSDAKRAEHANAAKDLRNEGRVEREKKLTLAIDFLQANGEVLESELKDLSSKFGDVATEAQIRGRFTVPVRAETATAPRRKDVLDASLAKGIAQKLDELKFMSLYEFLGEDFKPTTELAQLRKRAVELWESASKNQNKDQRTTLTGDLAGQAKTQFATAESKKRYDDTLEEAEFDRLRAEVTELATLSNTISPKQLEMLVASFCQTSNIQPAAALDVIREHARANRWRITDPRAADAVGKLQACGYCRNLNMPDARHCKECGRLLVEACPKCSSPVPTGHGACHQCGFPSGNRLLVNQLCDDVDQACKSRRFDEAADLLEQARQAWPQVSAGPLAERIQALGKKVEPAQAQRTALLLQLKEAVSQSRFYAARELLERAHGYLPDGAGELRTVTEAVENGLQTTARLLVAARTQSGKDPEAQVVAYQAVLEVCVDCQEALRGLARTPPEPPQELRARVSGNMVNLVWRASRSRGVQYAVVRKARSRPVSAADGTSLATVAACSFEDVSPDVGVPVFYGVFAKRGNAVSPEGALLQAPVQIVGEVSGLTPRIEDRRVLLQWKAPANALRVLVSRSTTGQPRTPADGQNVPVLGDGQANDSGVENGRTYSYAVFCQFSTHDGGTVTSSGVGLQVVPQKPPEPIRELRITSEEGSGEKRVRIRWTPPAVGDVLILQSNTSFERRCGDVVPRQSMRDLGEALRMEAGSATDRIGGTVFSYYLPVVVFQEAAYLGQEHRFTSVDEASGLRYDNLGHVIRLQWDWPRNCNEVLLAHSYERWPVVDAAGTSSVPLMRAQYDLRGFFDIECPAQADYYVAIHTVYGLAGQQVMSAGACRMKIAIRSRMEVTYAIRRSLIGSALKLELTVTGEGTLPDMVLVRKQGSLPMSKSDGEAAFRVSPVAAMPSGVSIKLPAGIGGSQYFGRLFLQDEGGYDFVTIRNPEKERLRLF